MSERLVGGLVAAIVLQLIVAVGLVQSRDGRPADTETPFAAAARTALSTESSAAQTAPDWPVRRSAEVATTRTQTNALASEAPLAAPEPPPTVEEIYAAHGVSVPLGPVERAGCPPPPPGPSAGGSGSGGSSTPRTPWTPDTVAEEDLPAVPPVTPWTTRPEDPAEGMGMWIWQYSQTENENFQAIVDRAVDSGFDHIWIRVGDSRDGFYAGERMNTLVPLAHEAGLKVIGWGFPFLHDPVEDVEWSRQAMDWVGPHGRGLDGFSPDIEMATEGVVLTTHRVELYLSLLREAAGDLPLQATVYPPVDWVVESGYPYEEMAKYVDSFATMSYWMCGEPGHLTEQSIERLQHLRPVHVIGQAFHNDTKGRRVAPSGAETLRFADVAMRNEATGISLWVWQTIDDKQWEIFSSYPWHDAREAHRAHGGGGTDITGDGPDAGAEVRDGVSDGGA